MAPSFVFTSWSGRTSWLLGRRDSPRDALNSTRKAAPSVATHIIQKRQWPAANRSALCACTVLLRPRTSDYSLPTGGHATLALGPPVRSAQPMVASTAVANIRMRRTIKIGHPPGPCPHEAAILGRATAAARYFCRPRSAPAQIQSGSRSLAKQTWPSVRAQFVALSHS